jgi:hypothetical protein
VLRFLHAHHLVDQVRLWITQQKGLHMRLSGQAFSSIMIDELCTLFPAKETAKHPGLAISRLLIEAQGGYLLYATNALPKDPYTEFIITLPHAEEIPCAGVEVV